MDTLKNIHKPLLIDTHLSKFHYKHDIVALKSIQKEDNYTTEIVHENMRPYPLDRQWLCLS